MSRVHRFWNMNYLSFWTLLNKNSIPPKIKVVHYFFKIRLEALLMVVCRLLFVSKYVFEIQWKSADISWHWTWICQFEENQTYEACFPLSFSSWVWIWSQKYEFSKIGDFSKNLKISWNFENTGHSSKIVIFVFKFQLRN